MADFIQGLDPSKLVLSGTVLSFLISPFAAPVYNLPIFLFGIYAVESTESVLPLQTFSGLLSGSVIFDIVWMIRNEQSGFMKLLTVALQLLKIPTFLAFASALRARGAHFGVGGLGIRGADINGPNTIWSMPGGFTSNGRDGYQAVDEESGIQRPKPPATTPSPPHQTGYTGAPAALGGYQTG